MQRTSANRLTTSIAPAAPLPHPARRRLGPFYVEQRRENRNKRVAGAGLKLHPPANESCNGSLASNTERLVRIMDLDQVEEINRRRREAVRHGVSISSCHYHEITPRQPHRLRHAGDLEPAISAINDVKHCTVSGYANTPRPAELRPEVPATSKAYPSQEIVEQRLTPRIKRRPASTVLFCRHLTCRRVVINVP